MEFIISLYLCTQNSVVINDEKNCNAGRSRHNGYHERTGAVSR